MKLAFAFAGLVLCSTRALRISSDNHEGFMDNWNNFWLNFGKSGEPQNQ